MSNSTRDTGPAKLPGLPAVTQGNLLKVVQALVERSEVREGARGNPYERAVTVREMANAGFFGFGGGQFGGAGQVGNVLAVGPDGTYTAMTPDAFAEGIRKSKLYKDLMKRLDDATRFDGLPEQVKAILLNDLAAEAAKRGADIQRLEFKLQSATESLAYTVEEVTASVQGSMAGVRETVFASATASNATAGVVTQLTAALDGTGSATAEESLVVIADRAAGLSSQYMLKLNAGNAVAGIGLMASEDPSGLTTSEFIVQADKFAVVMPGLSAGVPFGVDASGVYINGSLRVNGGGASLNSLATATGVYISYDTQFFKYTSAGVSSNSVINLTANLTGTLTGFVTWSVVSGYTGTVPTANTTNTWVLNLADMTGDAATFLATKVDGLTTYTDTVTAVKLRDGSDSITAILTNESHSVSTDSAGNNGNFTGASSIIKIYQGTTDVTSQWTFTATASAVAGTFNGSALPVAVGFTGVASPTVVATALSADVGSVAITATKSGMPTQTKVFSLTKSKQGDAGGPGASGSSSALVYAYKRSASDLIAPWNTATNGPGAVTWTFASASITTPAINALSNSWTKAIPAGTDPLYVTVTTAAGSGATDGIAASEWATPAILTQNGLNTATATLYQRNSSPTVGPAVQANTVTFTFATGGMAGMSGSWTAAIPAAASGAYLWVTRATASGSGATDTLASGEWSAPVLYTQDGAAGTRGTLTGSRGSVGTSWSDNVANAIILDLQNGAAVGTTTSTASTTHLRVGDSVTQSFSLTPFSSTKYWSGASWLTAAVVINGNAVVSGTLAASALVANSITATQLAATNLITSTLQIGANLVTVPDRAADTTSTTINSSIWTDVLSKVVAFGTEATSGCHVAITVQLVAPASPTAISSYVRVAISTDGTNFSYGDQWQCIHTNTQPISISWSQANAFTGNVTFKVQVYRGEAGWTCSTKVLHIMGTKR